MQRHRKGGISSALDPRVAAASGLAAFGWRRPRQEKDSAFQNCFSSPQLCRRLVLLGASGGVGQTPQSLVNLTEQEGLGQVADDGPFLGFTSSGLEQNPTLFVFPGRV